MPETFDRAALHVRIAEPGEAAIVASVLYEAFAQYRALYTSAAFDATVIDGARVAARMREGPVWLALMHGVAAGTVAAAARGSATYVRGMGVLPWVRGSGIGRALLAATEAFAIARGSDRLVLSTTPFLVEAIRLYEKLGFERSGDDSLFGTPLFGMSKPLERRPNTAVELHSTRDSDLAFVRSAEAAPHASPFIERWNEPRHAAALLDPDIGHYVVVAPVEQKPVGFVLLAGLRRADSVIELRRIVITSPGRGFGRAAIRCVKRMVFDSLRGERLWLDVKPDNLRARALYLSEGFREESAEPQARPSALVVMSLRPLRTIGLGRYFGTGD